MNHLSPFNVLFRIAFLCSISILFTFQSQAQSCYTTVDWEISPWTEYPDSDTINICVDVQEYFYGANWLHGVSISLPDSWELIGTTSDEDCGDGEWIFVDNPPYPNLGPGYYYDTFSGGPQDGNPFNNYGAAACSTVTFCFQVRMVEVFAEELNSLEGSSDVAVTVVGDNWISWPDWGPLPCSYDAVTHYLDLNVSPIFNGQEVIGEFEVNPSYCTPETVELQLLEMGTDEIVETQTVSVNEDGTYSTYIDSYGEFDIRVKGNGVLAEKLLGVNLEGGITELEAISIIPGDVNGDNQVNIVDISFFSLGFGLSEDDDGFYPPFDLNCDGYVNILDVSILAISYGLSGE